MKFRGFATDSLRYPAIVTAVLVLTTCLGCGNKTKTLTGKITFDGNPLDQGQITFEPKGPGKMSVAQIVEGTYTLPDKFGLTPGDYVVRITSERPTGAKVRPASYSQDQTPMDVYQQFLPAKYNTKSTLSVSVSPDGENVHDFALTSGK